MGKVVYFCIPAYGHTNPTIAVVRELVKRGHEVWYYSFAPFREKIEDTGAHFIPCDHALPELKSSDEKKIGKDFAALIEMVADTTIALNEQVCRELTHIAPDCIVTDSLCFWGKLFARKLAIPWVCSTTTFAFNEHTAKLMKGTLPETLRLLTGMPRINRKISQLRRNGFPIENFISIIQNDNHTDTIVYTSKEFQPMAELFSQRYAFVGPSIDHISVPPDNRTRQRVYISLGTVNNRNRRFYQNCIEAFRKENLDIVMSVGEKTDISSFYQVPEHFHIFRSVDQIRVLQNTDVFITHCGMNSVNESLYYGVPMVLCPQQEKQRLVAAQAAAAGAGIPLKHSRSEDLKSAVREVLGNDRFKVCAQKLADSFSRAGGAAKAADTVCEVMNRSR
ncbi:glucosyltransferase [Lactonifactor longoviformis]|uniref:Glycosyltransferase, MGT family n=1 Tax=Lactonifactor longoviformis DSM 17459 TaxID=1122155 RepID=A0A1M4ZK65_9CLOT|nr:macrolide family glycosyltransferase [Lactonifactor longoviformis]POP34129.1 glucosyltransferase [Lactonifactor longoviformis]SHF17956.1 glycosyltransferase, MGT family [Lactonifactor longoviformis DSM 17459]